MVAPIRFLSGRQQQQKIGIIESTENDKVLEVVGRVGIGTTIFDADYNLDVRGTVSIAGPLEVQEITITGDAPSEFNNITVTGVATFTSDVGIASTAILTVEGLTNLNEVNVTGVTTFSNDVGVTSTSTLTVDSTSILTVEGLTNLNEVNVTGVTTFSNDVGISSTSTLTVDSTSILTVEGLTNLNEVNVTGVTTFSNDVGIASTSTLTVDSTSILTVEGLTNLNEVNVTGVTTFSNDVGIASTSTLTVDSTSILTVEGLTNLNEVNVTGIATFTDRVIFDSTNSIQIPVGTTAERDIVGVAVTGQIRYNTELSSFEGYGPGGEWGSLGGVKDVDQDTYIIPELSAGSDDDTLFFYTGGNLSGTISSTTGAIFNVDVGIGTTQPLVALDVAGVIREELHSPTMPVGLNDDIGVNWTKVEMGAGLEQIRSLVYCGNGIVLAGSGSGTGDGDIYRSTDFGQTWIQIEMGAGLEYILSLVYCGNGIVLAGSGSGTGDGDIYRSTDFGQTWIQIEMGAGLEGIFSLVYCGNGIVLAGSGANSGDGDIYRSTDFGLTWTQIEMGAGLEYILSLVYCGNGIVLAGSGSAAGNTGAGDIYRSTDFGLTWTQIEMGAGLERILSLVYCGNGIILAGSGATPGDGDIYRSTDFGLTWTQIEMGAGLEQILSLVYCGNGIVLAGSGVSVGDGDIYRSTDFGLTWTKIYDSTTLEYIHSLIYCGNGIVLAGSGFSTGDGDIYRSDVGFSQATSLQGVYHEHLTGNIGIGTTQPTAKLDVLGQTELDDLNVTGVTTFSNDLEVSGIATFRDRVIFDSTNSVQIPVGTTAERDGVGVAVTGQIRYNTDLSTFEGYGPGGEWGSLGGVKDVDGNTYIVPELFPGSNNDILYFYTGGSLSATISSTSTIFNSDVGIGSTVPTATFDIGGTFNVSGISTFRSDVNIDGNLNVGGITTTGKLHVGTNNIGITTILDEDDLISNSDTALATQQSIKTYVDNADAVLGNQIANLDLDFSADTGSGTINLATESITYEGTANEIVTSVPSDNVLKISLPDDVTIQNNLTVVNDIFVTGNVFIGGTSADLQVNNFKVQDKNIVLGFTTDVYENEVSSDSIANGGGISIASTEGSPLVDLYVVGIDTIASTYKRLHWYDAGAFSGLGTDAWLSNYAVGVGSTALPYGTYFAAGNVQITKNDISNVRDVYVNNNLVVNNNTIVGSARSTLSTTVPTPIYTGLSTTIYRSVEYTIQSTEGSNFQSTKVLAIHDGTNAYHSEYGTIQNNTTVATFDVDVSGDNIRLLAIGAKAFQTEYVINFVATKL